MTQLINASGVLEVRDAAAAHSHFDDVDLSNARFVNVNLSASSFDNVLLSNVRITDANLSGVVLSNVNLNNVQIEKAQLAGMTIDGVQVSDLFKAYEAAQAAGDR